ncbi:aspartate aminotransferase family protein [Anaerolineales bacterium]
MTLNWMEREDQYTSGVYAKRPLTIVKGEGCYVYDDTGKAYLDATSGIGVAALGHQHPQLTQAIQEQTTRIITCSELFYNDKRTELYEALNEITPDSINRFFLCNSGTEAIEAAIKAARLFTNRDKIVATQRGFHGRSLGALAMTWNTKYREPFSAWLSPHINHVTYNDLEATLDLITEETACIVLEPIQGEAGIYPADAHYLKAVRERCDTTHTLMIVDEVQSGMGRTGKWFAFEHANIEPDIIAMAKGLAGGLSMGAIAWQGKHGQLPASSHGSTFGGNPLACAASLATIRAIQEEDLLNSVSKNGAIALAALREIKHPFIREIRGQGYMIGIELRQRVSPILKQLQENGVLVLAAGKTTLRLLPPLTMTEQQLSHVIHNIESALNDIYPQ